MELELGDNLAVVEIGGFLNVSAALYDSGHIICIQSSIRRCDSKITSLFIQQRWQALSADFFGPPTRFGDHHCFCQFFFYSCIDSPYPPKKNNIYST